jgi:hypothetical protein
VYKPIGVETYLLRDKQHAVESSVGSVIQLGTTLSGGREMIHFVAVRHLHVMFREPALRVVYVCV